MTNIVVVICCFFSAEVDQEFNPPPPSVEYLSTTKKDFSKGGSHIWAAESELMVLLVTCYNLHVITCLL